MVNLYDQIDACLNVLYDFMYNKDSKECYTFNNITRMKVTVNDLKKSPDFDPSEVLGDSEKFKLLGKHNERVHFKRYGKSSYPCMISIGKYEKGSHNDIARKELYDIGMLYMIGEIAANESFFHTQLPIMFFDISFTDLKKLNKSISKEIDANDGDELYILVTEMYFESKTLSDYLDEHANDMDEEKWRVLLFQVIYSLAKLHHRFNNFRHNMLNLDSILVIEKKSSASGNAYKLGETSFKVPNGGFDIKIKDFMYANTSDYVKNTDAPATKDNPYYDLHYFLNSLYFKIKEKNIKLIDNVQNFINGLLPNIFLHNDKDTFKGLDEDKFDANSSQIVIPSMILKKNKFFDKFISKDTETTLSPSEMNRLNIEMNRVNIEQSGNSESSAIFSPTDYSSDVPRMLGREISSEEKKSREYYKRSMIGSRKITVPNFGNMTESSSDDHVMLGHGGRSKRVSDNDDSESSYEAEVSRLKKELHQKFDKSSEASSSDGEELSDLQDTIVENSRKASRVSKMLEEHGKKKSSKKSKSKKHSSKKSKKAKSHKSSSASSDVSLSVTESGRSESQSASKSVSVTESSASSSHKKRSSKKNKNTDPYNFDQYLDSATRNKLNSLPEGYFGEVPDHIKAQIPFDGGLGGEIVGDVPPMGNVPPEGMGMGMPGMGAMNGMMGMPGQMGMPGMPQMPSMGMGQIDPTLTLDGPELSPPNMVGDFQQPSMPPMGNVPPQMGMPGMPGMPPMGPMMGGGSKNDGGYVFKNDNKNEKNKKKDNFFFYRGEVKK